MRVPNVLPSSGPQPPQLQRTFPGVEGKTLQLMGAHSYGDGCHVDGVVTRLLDFALLAGLLPLNLPWLLRLPLAARNEERSSPPPAGLRPDPLAEHSQGQAHLPHQGGLRAAGTAQRDALRAGWWFGEIVPMAPGARILDAILSNYP